MGHGGPVAQAGDAERANDAESEYDVHVPKPTGEAVLKEGVWNDAVPKSHVRESDNSVQDMRHTHTQYRHSVMRQLLGSHKTIRHILANT